MSNKAELLTPSAIKAELLFVKRIFGISTVLMDYNLVHTMNITQLEYGTISLTEVNTV